MNRDFIKGGRGGGHHFMKWFHKKRFFHYWWLPLHKSEFTHIPLELRSMPSILGSAQWAPDMSESIWLLPRLVLCRTAKHGSTSWANNFVKMYLRDKRTVKTQVYLRRLEGKAFTREAKEAVIRGLREKQHNYTSFFVCRNPVEKFLSVYNYLMDARVRFEAKLKTKH